ncbi:hypothetical protein PRIPAC_81605 [Pristionchus pacificus]|uniref:CRAL-TRIO domain containing protein n=1 Tax=Pristionchus pacificus TaxID=54126 RepID=A0A2A6C3X4_PRIPA|nr:hypothetical protein PRIPAC_81605 [Pristionchus pacificus]|eukprot:PDM72830.1 CRAL-TRIO domain containing protein [Pristionchus pacificus]
MLSDIVIGEFSIKGDCSFDNEYKCALLESLWVSRVQRLVLQGEQCNLRHDDENSTSFLADAARQVDEMKILQISYLTCTRSSLYRMTSDDSRVAELRALVSSNLTPYYDTHFNLLRWIQGNPGMPMDKIAARLRHHLQFRACSWEIESIREREKGYHPLHSYWPRTKCGLSGVVPNCIVHVEQSGRVDFEGMVDNYSITEITKASLHGLEEMLADVMKIEKETGQQGSIITVMDAEGIEYSKKLFDTTLRTMRTMSEFMADHYVELVSSIVVVNVPSWANMLWAMESPKNTIKLVVKAGKDHCFEYKLAKGDQLAFHITGNNNFGFAVVHADNEYENYVTA